MYISSRLPETVDSCRERERNTMDITRIVAQSQFTPTAAQIRRRKQFWDKQAGDLPEDITVDQALQYGAHTAIRQWWNIPGFTEWFLDRDYSKHEAEALLHTAMQKLQAVLRDSGDNAELINAAKEARNLHAQLHNKPAESDSTGDSEIDKMSREELEQFLAARSNVLKSLTK